LRRFLGSWWQREYSSIDNQTFRAHNEQRDSKSAKERSPHGLSPSTIRITLGLLDEESLLPSVAGRL
jgi:hypothetical protein